MLVMRRLLWVMIGLAILPSMARAGLGEVQQELRGPGCRIVINRAGNFEPSRKTLIVIYALPNGNTIEQTLGARLEPGMDWHFDIQHIAAQIRKLRQVDPDENIVLGCVEAEKKSWPAWRAARADNGKLIRGIVEQISRAVPGTDKRIALTAHSGGGSFIFGYLNGGDAIAREIQRIAWIDATYAYDDAQHHGEKLLAWLKGDVQRHLIVIAYDDRDVKFNGKNIVSPTGGTYYRSHKMIERFRRDVSLSESKRGDFEEFTGMHDQIHFLIHTNPEKKILHTVLVERNGLLEALTWGTAEHDKWGGVFWGERAYSDLIEPAPKALVATTSSAKGQATSMPSAANGGIGRKMIPARPAGARGGHAFAKSIADLPRDAMGAAVVKEILRGNIPDFERKFVPVHVSDRGRECTYEVMPDYLAIGSDSDYVRMPMTPQNAMRIARAFGCTLPTRKMVDQIYAAAKVKLEPKPLTTDRESMRTFIQFNDIIEHQLKGRKPGSLVAGDKKDVVITNRLKEKPHKVAIYGWHKLDGKPIQPLYVGHADYYYDYSHGIRLIQSNCIVDGKPTTVEKVLSDPELCGLLSDEGVIEAGI
jgi:hypothetical protein